MISRILRVSASVGVICTAFAAPNALAQTTLSLDVLSSRPQLVTGGSALVKITGTSATPAVSVDGNDVSSAFKSDSKGGWIGLVEGLKDGNNRLVAKAGTSEA